MKITIGGKIVAAALLLSAVVLAIGCNKVNPPKTNPLETEQKKVIANKGRLVGDLASPSNMSLAKIEGVCLVEGLADTGADEPPSTYATMVLQEMQRDPEKKKSARQKIASLSTAVVLLETVVPPGARKGDRLDVNVALPPGSEATSLEGGYLENARLHEYMAADIIRKGALNGLVTGRVTLDPELLEREPEIARKKGKIIGGAVVVRPREIWLTVKEEERSAGIAKRIEDVINSRFNYRRNGSKREVAKATGQASRINLVVPDEYRENVNRYVNVVCCISFFETPDENKRRLEELKTKLHNPGTSEFASLQLEAIGPNNALCVEALRSGLESPTDAVRYHSAMAMAYLNIAPDRSRTALILAHLARENALLRPSCLAVLGTTLKSSPEADQALRELLSVNSNETRYGAFRALWTRNPADYMIQGTDMNGKFSYHCLNCDGPPMIHVTLSKRPEVVLFAKDKLVLRGNFELDAGPRIAVRSQGSDVIVKRYTNGVDEQRIVTTRLDDVIRAVSDVGGSYAELIEFLVAAKKSDVLAAVDPSGTAPAALAFDALPGANSTAFKRIRDIDELERQERLISGEDEKETPSFWARMNPADWFGSDKGEVESEDFSQTFSDESDSPSDETFKAAEESGDTLTSDSGGVEKSDGDSEKKKTKNKKKMFFF